MATNPGVTLQSSSSADLWTIDTGSLAGRITMYDVSGSELNAIPGTGSYFVPINLRHTAATAAGSVVWAMRNGGPGTFRIRTLFLNLGFDGPPVALSNCGYSVERFSGGTSGSNNSLSAVDRSPVKKRSSYPSSSLTGANGKFVDYKDNATTGLTYNVTPTYETDAIIVRMPISNANSVSGSILPFQVYFNQPNENYSCFELAAGEGLAILVNPISASVGQSLTGFVEWDEV